MSHGRLRTQFNERALCALDIETVSSEQMEDGGFPPWPTHRCVVASMLTADLDHYGEWAFAVESVMFEEDPRALDRIDELLQGRSALSMNGRGFDFPVLLLHAQKARKFKLHALTAAAMEPRFSSARHYDLADKFSQYGGARGASLERLCTALCIPAKIAAHGNEVGELHAAGETQKIAQYCEQDTASTLLAAAYFRAIETGNPTYHAALTYQFARWAKRQGEHLHPYANFHATENLLQLSLLAQIDAALEVAQMNAECRAMQALEGSFVEVSPY
ncbi:MAG TPA: hypothetical protein VF662_06670 [Allosphingosinicella sp.]|jgi:predicted PolB exonuclease-like 3'-5' exonuclease